MFKDIILGLILCFALFYPSVVTQEQPKVLTKEEQRDVLRETQCLTEAGWFEARNQGQVGIDAVYSVIINRTKSGKYPKTYCEVINQPYQFSFRNNIKYNTGIKINPSSTEKQLLKDIQNKAIMVVFGKFDQNLPYNVLFYHNQKIKPDWGKKFKKYAVINDHVFYLLDFPRPS
jgi:N-acetylmuramoyl-L-alanine amidase